MFTLRHCSIGYKVFIYDKSCFVSRTQLLNMISIVIVAMESRCDYDSGLQPMVSLNGDLRKGEQEVMERWVTQSPSHLKH